MQKTTRFKDLPVKALFKFKNDKTSEVMEKFDETTCGFRWAADGMYPVNPYKEVIWVNREGGEYTCFGN